ncbi:uncharacterized protein CC84DRAFT_1094201 [Paraphaeosphaeria sporulosa]|uniref:Rhodopsin domain-containing protein n=1 Tax=Paraphaeosphaeria sporulosa TaxID=1460663 RepID=A0A177CCW0_9PLEO|nr:uncharacterized protein CC84DRAFT_1094201 [Paraphaeosphaeria sporulosa]OAG04639.1 hypothetical protein CC84DRAFT_1094201 [Paraphaeosphaeria sporulosa]
MAGATAPGLAICTLLLLVFDVLSWALRFYVRLSRKAWGPDDWCMLIAIPIFAISTTGMLGIAFTGGGLRDDQLTSKQQETAMFWWFIMQTMWCLAAIPVKWSICFTLLRIANKQLLYTIPIYCCMGAVFLVMTSTTIYEFFHCDPVAMNWKPTKIPNGHCNAQSNITGFSFALSAVSIFTDWFCALVPIPLLWNVQMDTRIKLSVIALLSLGIIASIAPLVRLSITVNLSATKNFLYNAMDVAAWAQAEVGIGIIVANLPALRPLLEKVLSLRSTIRSDKRSKQQKSTDRYLELEEGLSSQKQHSKSASQKGTETRIYGGTTVAGDSNSTLGDDHSQKNIVTSSAQRDTGNGIMVDREVQIRVSQG